MDDAFDLETLRRAARVAGFDWTEDELDALRPMAQSVLRLLATLETIPLGAIEPTTHYRIV
jgi:Asp-tRNA(Asn)/Glu-tRNA(Gln) amidotransferase C subunit